MDVPKGQRIAALRREIEQIEEQNRIYRSKGKHPGHRDRADNERRLVRLDEIKRELDGSDLNDVGVWINSSVLAGYAILELPARLRSTSDAAPNAELSPLVGICFSKTTDNFIAVLTPRNLGVIIRVITCLVLP